MYFDNAATTRMSERAADVMTSYLLHNYENPESLHIGGRAASEAVEAARGQIAKLLDCKPDKIIFTSGGTESNNMVFEGLKTYLKQIGKTHILVSSIEHDSVLRPSHRLEREGLEVGEIPADENGSITIEAIEPLIKENTGLVSVMAVNNETGVVNHVVKIGEWLRKKEILFHTDFTQALISRPFNASSCDFATFSAHKIHGPKGIGALYCRNADILEPLILGGEHQEFGLRGGTVNVPAIAGFGAAAEELSAVFGKAKRRQPISYTKADFFFAKLYKSLVDNGENADAILRRNGKDTNGLILNVSIVGVDGQTLVALASRAGVYISAGSACSSYVHKPSHVLKAMGLSDDEALSAVRISFSPDDSGEEMTEAANIIGKCIAELRGAACSIR